MVNNSATRALVRFAFSLGAFYFFPIFVINRWPLRTKFTILISFFSSSVLSSSTRRPRLMHCIHFYPSNVSEVSDMDNDVALDVLCSVLFHLDTNSFIRFALPSLLPFCSWLAGRPPRRALLTFSSTCSIIYLFSFILTCISLNHFFFSSSFRFGASDVTSSHSGASTLCCHRCEHLPPPLSIHKMKMPKPKW